MTQIVETHRRETVAPMPRLLARLVRALVDADRRYRDNQRLKELPPERLDDLGLPRPTGILGGDAVFQAPSW